jgi:hypothetical protein
MVPGSMNHFGELVEWWAGATTFQYTSIYDLLVWVPQHAMGGWISTLLLILALEKNLYKLLPIITSLTLLWSPFSVLGQIPIYVYLLLKMIQLREIKSFFFSIESVFSLGLLGMMAAYYSSNIYPQPFAWQYSRMTPESFFFRYPLFVVLEFFLMAILLYPHRHQWPISLKGLFFPVMIYLFFIPHVYYGVYSDYSMRASIPGMIYLFIIYFITLTAKNTPHYKRGIFILYALIASYSALSDVYRGFNLIDQKIYYHSVTRFDPDNLSRQYLGAKESFFFKYLIPNN